MALRNRRLGTVEALQGQILQETDSGAVVDNERVYQGGSGTKYEDISSQTYKTSIARIRAAKGLNPNIIYKTMDFGVPGEWQVDESDITSTDNTGTVLVTADGVRLKRRYSGNIFAGWFNLAGDGSDETAVFQEIINLASLLKKCILVPEGEYTVSGLDIKSDTYIIGTGAKSIFRQKDNAAVPLLTNSGPISNVRIVDLYIDGNLTNQIDQNVRLVSLNNITDLTIRGCSIFNTDFHAISIETGERVSVTGCRISDTNGHGVYLNAVTDFIVSNNIFKNIGDEGSSSIAGSSVHTIGCAIGSVVGNVSNNNSDSCYYFSASSDITADGNTSYDCGKDGIKFQNGSRRGVISNNTIIRPGNNGVLANLDVGDYTEQIVITGNYVFDAGQGGGGITLIQACGIYIERARDILIADNMISGSYGHGIRGLNVGNAKVSGNYSFGNGESGISFSGEWDSASVLSLENNTSYNNGNRTGGNGIAVGTSNVLSMLVCANNTCFDNRTTKTQGFGIRVTGTIDYLKMMGNMSRTADHVGLGINDTSTSIRKYNSHNIISNNQESNYHDPFHTDGMISAKKFRGSVVEITGTVVDFSLGSAFWKEVSADTILSLTNLVSGDFADIQITNTDVATHTVTVSGVSFPDGASNSIPAGGRAHIRLQQINGIIDSDIKIYT